MIQAATLANALNSKSQRADLLDSTTQKLQAAANGPLNTTSAKMVAKEFEKLFLGQMMEHMMGGDSIGESLFGNAETDEIYQGMMVENYAKAITDRGGIGIASYIEKSLMQRALIQTQEVDHANTNTIGNQPTSSGSRA